jgi:hypothetical protein
MPIASTAITARRVKAELITAPYFGKARDVPSAHPGDMIRSLLRAIAALAFAALIAPVAPSASPAPGIAYDEIVRVLVSATPPPPGTFAADEAAVAANPAPLATPAAEPHRRGMLGTLAASVLARTGLAHPAAGEAASNGVEDALRRSLGLSFETLADAMDTFVEPRLLRYAYWNGWERVDDVAARTATIRKCDLDQVITLDLASKTYRVSAPDEEPSAVPARAPSHRGREADDTPGTVVVALHETTTSLGTLRIENQAAQGYDTTTTVATTQATGSCRDGGATIRTVQYLGPLQRPTVNACPIDPALLPEDAAGTVTRATSGGCRPTFTARRSGPTPPSTRLALYSLVELRGRGDEAHGTPGSASDQDFAFLTERGNLRPLGPADADLFAIPPGFTQAR